MGYYIQTESNTHKVASLVNNFGGELLQNPPNEFLDIPKGKALICVVDNGLFEAAALLYNEPEFRQFTDSSDHRSRVYVLLDKNRAYSASGYQEPASFK